MTHSDVYPHGGGQVDAQITMYINHLANWPRANYCWNYESGRYFGSKGSEYQRTRLVPLLPKRPRNPELRATNVEVPLVDDIGKMGLLICPSPTAFDSEC